MALITALINAPAVAQPAEPLDPSVVLGQLNEPDYAAREDATRRLLQDQTIPLDDLRALYSRAETPEQRHRVMDVFRHHALRTMRERSFDETDAAPAVGFSHEVLPAGSMPGIDGPAIHVSATLPGFPAHAFLESGDLIVSVDEQPLPDEVVTERFTQVLQRYRAGQMITLGVVRRGERLRMQLRLAGMDALEQIYADNSPPSLRPPFLQQWTAMQTRLLAEVLPPPVLRVSPAPSATTPEED